MAEHAPPAGIDAAAQLRHELRTPLNHVIGYAEMLLEELADAGETAPGVDSLRERLEALRADARDLLTRLNHALGQGQAVPDRQAVRAAVAGPLARVRSAAEEASRRADATGSARLQADVERIRGAAAVLDDLLSPAGRAAAEPAGGAGAGAPAAGPEASRRSLILVVDDNDDNREMLARRLRRQGHAVTTAAGGQAALAALAGQPADLVLLDVMMPDLDGYAVLERLKRDPALRDIPVVMISALDELDSVVRCIQLGAEDYLSKPFDPVLLQARIGACLDKKRLHDEEARHRAALAELNRTLEQRVAEQVAQLERLGRLKRFFSPQLAELIVAGGADDPLATHRREIIVVFLDLRGFTAFAETAEPEEVMAVLHAYHAEMGRLVLQHEGTLERFTGDGMMIFFNDPVPVPDAPARAVRMAVAMRESVARLADGWRKRGWDLGLGVGIAQGYATIGAIGFEGRWDYGAIGTVTNLAARLCSEAHAGDILASSRVIAAVEPLVEAEEVGTLTLKGLARPVPAWRVGGLRASPP
jgi:class 3 adenylate cyclase